MSNHSITVGKSKTGKDINIPLDNPLRVGILGMSGSGKSVLLNNIVCLLAREMGPLVQFVGIDPKLNSIIPLKERLAVPIVSEPTDFLPTMQKLEQLLLDRLHYMEVKGITKLDPWRDGEKFPQIICIFEELLSITNNSDIPKSSIDSIKDFFLTYMSRVRAANMGFIICSHTYSQTETIPVAARSQISTRFLMQSGVNESKLMAEGMHEMCPAYQLSDPGSFYFAHSNFNIWTKGKTFYNSDERINEICTAYSKDVRDIGLSWDVENPFEI